MRQRHRLTALAVRTAGAGLHHDGDGLYLQVTETGARSWLLRYKRSGKQHWMGLGPLSLVPLADARKRGIEARRLLLDGIDPIEAKRKQRAPGGVTFRECAEKYIQAHKSGWRNEKHAAQWQSTLETYAFPTLADLPVAAIEVGHVMAVLDTLWNSKTETASRVRQRIECVLDWSKARGYRGGENPARWRGHLDKLLPRRSKVAPVEHHAALKWEELPAFYAALAKLPGTGALALRFAILTAARSGEVQGCAWSEIDEAGALWTVPASRMKAAKEHRVPLCTEAIDILAQAKHPDAGAFAFETSKDKPPSNALMASVLRRMERPDLTVHGFRSTFRDWCGESTSYPRELAEAALAHRLKDKAEAAYARGDALARRRELMQSWCSYVTSEVQP